MFEKLLTNCIREYKNRMMFRESRVGSYLLAGGVLLATGGITAEVADQKLDLEAWPIVIAVIGLLMAGASFLAPKRTRPWA